LPQFHGVSAAAPASQPSESPADSTGVRTAAADSKTLEAVLFAANNEELHIRRRQYRLSLLPPSRKPPDVKGPVNNDIDRFILAAWSAAGLDGSHPEVCTDAVFVHRVYLDLIGVIPTLAESQRFLDDRAADKRARLIDALLARSGDYADHWTPFWEDALGSMTVEL